MKTAGIRIAVDASSLLTRHPCGESRSLLRLHEEIARIRPDWRFIFFGTQAKTRILKQYDRNEKAGERENFMRAVSIKVEKNAGKQ